MNLRTITLWALYSPSRKAIISFRQFKYQLKPRKGCVLVKLKGHYFPPLTASRSQSRGHDG